MVTAVCLSNKQSSPTFKYGLEEVQLPHVEPKENETLVKIQAASLNHRYSSNTLKSSFLTLVNVFN